MSKQILSEEFKKMQELAGIKSNNPVNELINILQQAITLANANISKAENFDLENFSQKLDKYVDELTKIGNFRKY